MTSSVIAAQGPPGGLMFYWQTIGTAPWHAEQVAQVAGPDTAVAMGPSIAQIGTSSVIAATAPDNSLMFYWQTIGTVPWHAEQVAGPGTTFSSPSIAQVGDSSIIAAIGPDNSLIFYWPTI